MSSSPPSLSSLQHLDRLFTVARVLTASQAHAAELVTLTYRETAAADDLDVDSIGDLLRVMVRLHARGAAKPSSASGEAATPYHELRYETAQAALRRVLPRAFASQSHRDRVLLTLCDVDGLSVEEAASILDLSVNATRRQLVDARDSLHASLQTEFSAAERQLADATLSEDDLRAAIRTYAQETLGTAPPSLRADARSVLTADTPSEPLLDASETDSENGLSPAANDSSTSSGDSEEPVTPASDTSGDVSARRIRRVLTGILLVAGLALAGYWLYPFESPAPPPTDDLVALALQQADDVTADLETEDAAEATTFIRDEIGADLAPPAIEGAPLRGVSVASLTSQVRLPVFFLHDTTADRPLVVFGVTYALLDRYQESATLDDNVRRQLEDETAPYEQATADGSALLWRERDRIYITATLIDADQLSDRLVTSGLSGEGRVP